MNLLTELEVIQALIEGGYHSALQQQLIGDGSTPSRLIARGLTQLADAIEWLTTNDLNATQLCPIVDNSAQNPTSPALQSGNPQMEERHGP